MRLLHYDEDGRIRLTSKFSRDTIPSYAILSHTWLNEDEELTFEEIVNGSNKSKGGYSKLEFCAKQAKRDGLKYFWVDTCCINKADKAELRDAISSMFRWYQNAAKCYVFLSDVLCDKKEVGEEMVESSLTTAFRASRWFTRGWTLQELLAPVSVEFFSKEWTRLGDKKSLSVNIEEATKIPASALAGFPLSQFSIDERLKWSEHRETKVPEDRAYCLIGIFGSQMTPFYGEGVSGAFGRLMQEALSLEGCLRDLRLTDPRNDKRRIEDRKGGLLPDAYQWVLHDSLFRQWCDNSHSRLLWIKGDPGKGKTMLLCGIINELEELKTAPLSFFFCQEADSRINSATAVLRGLIYMLVHQQPSLAWHVRKKYDQAGGALFKDANAWIALSDIFMNMAHDKDLKVAWIVVDALDECVEGLSQLLDLIISTTASSTSLKWLMSSRNEIHIEQKLQAVGEDAKLSLELKQNAAAVAQAVDMYIDFKLSGIETLKDGALREQIRHELRRKANGTFLWVALIVQELEKPESWDPLAVVLGAPEGLEQLYDSMFNRIQRLRPSNSNLCRLLLFVTVNAYRPLYLAESGSLCSPASKTMVRPEAMRRIVAMCGSFITIRHEQIDFVHQSAKDFLSVKMQEVTALSNGKLHFDVFLRSLELMSTTLKRDIYNLVEPGFAVEAVKLPVPDPLAAVRYSCIHWVDHLHDYVLDSRKIHDKSLQDDNIVHLFLKDHYLHWLEALSLCQSVSAGVLAMNKLKTLVQDRPDTKCLTALVSSVQRFIMYYKVGVEKSPLQAYEAALLFSPAGSLTRKLPDQEGSRWITILAPLDNEWMPCLQTLEGHNSSVRSIAFSHDSSYLASASNDNTVRIWNPSNGECIKMLRDHTDWILSVAFSHDSLRLASASKDCSIRICNINNNKYLHILKGHTDWVWSVAFSHDSARLASASKDCTVRIWDPSNGECLQILEGHRDWVWSVAFSHDSAQLASASKDCTVRIWNPSNGECIKMLRDHTDWILSVAFSHDSLRLASASKDCSIRICNINNNKYLHILKGHTDWVWSVAFSHDSARLASASKDYTVRIWDPSNGECLQILEGHRDWVWSVAFSYDSAQVASASKDCTVKIWDPNSDGSPQIAQNHTNSVLSSVFSHDSRQLASASKDCTIKIWNTRNGKCLQTFRGHTDWVLSVAFSQSSEKLASASRDRTVKLWNMSNGDCLQDIQGHMDWVWSVTFSQDSKWLVSASKDCTARLWDISNGKCLHTFENSGFTIQSASFSHNALYLAIASSDCKIKVWNAKSGVWQYTLEGHTDWVLSVVFFQNSTRLASSSKDKSIKIWDAVNNDCLHTISIGRGLSSISTDISGLCLHTEIGSIVIDAAKLSKLPLDIANAQSPVYAGWTLSADGTWIMCDSQHVMWLPADYRPSQSAVHADKLVVFTGTGKMWMCNLRPRIATVSGVEVSQRCNQSTNAMSTLKSMSL